MTPCTFKWCAVEMENILSQVSTSGKGLRNVFHYNLSTTKTKGLSEDVTDKTRPAQGWKDHQHVQAYLKFASEPLSV